MAGKRKIANKVKPTERKAPAKARLMSSAEIRLKNKQATLKREIRLYEKEIEKLREKVGGDVDKRIKEKGRRARKVKTIINEKAGKITKLMTAYRETTAERQIVSKGKYKTKSKSITETLPEPSKVKRGVRKIGEYLAWMRNDLLSEIVERDTIYKVKITTIAGRDRDTEMFEILSEVDDIFNAMVSDDMLIAKINLATGAVFFEFTKKPDDNEEES